MTLLSRPTMAWLEHEFKEPTAVQARGWPCIASGANALLIAPTGSGKTLAAFLWGIDKLSRQPRESEGVRLLYVSPLKALAYDIDRNLRAPLAGIEEQARALGLTVHLPAIDIRTGDTSAKQRRRQVKHPADILVTTPESLYLLLGSQAREGLRTVETVIVDEIHALAPSKRGAHLSLSLERLSDLCDHDPQRIGLSATARPIQTVAAFLAGDRPVEVVDASDSPNLDLQIVVTVADMTRPTEPDDATSIAGPPGETGLWATVLPRIIELVRSHSTTIVFVNSRGLCERLCNRINDAAGECLARSHHGSLSHAERRAVEGQLAGGEVRALVATSSLELGIDMAAVDLVLMVESPSSVSSGLQRIGRAGHGVGMQSKGRLFPKHRGDLISALALAKRMRTGQLEELTVPSNCLDVLAQQVVAMVATEDRDLDALTALVRRAAGYRDIPDDGIARVLDMLSGHYPSTAFAELRPRLDWNRDSKVLSARPGAKMISLTNGGTIPDRGMYGVFLGETGSRVGELDEEMVNETIPGQTFTLGATTWRVQSVTRDRVIVSPAPGEPGKLPFWRGDGPGRSVELGRDIGALLRQLCQLENDEAMALLLRDHCADEWAARNAIEYVALQRENSGGSVPTDECLIIERFRDELGDWRMCILSPYGSRVHAPLALAIQAQFRRAGRGDCQPVWSDDGIMLRPGDDHDQNAPGLLLPPPEDLDELVLSELAKTSLFSGQFRENAARALLLPRRRPDARTPLWLQRLKSQQLLSVALEYPSFPIVMETYRSCLQDVFDMPALAQLLHQIDQRKIRVDHLETRRASPFARSLLFTYVGANLYEGDAPAAERRARALSLDRELLRELLGKEDLRELLDADIIADVEAELLGRSPTRRARRVEDVHDLLRRVGDLDDAEVSRCVDGDAKSWLAELASRGRATRIAIAGATRWVAVEDVALYRDALGCPVPEGIPDAFLESRQRPLADLVGRYARTHGPFEPGDVSLRFGLTPAVTESIFEGLEGSGRLVRGKLSPGSDEEELCDVDVLRRIKRRTLERLRGQVSPVKPTAIARFLPAWQGIGSKARGRARLLEVVSQLEGLPLSFAELERSILPARIAGYQPNLIDELGATGAVVWVGHGRLGSRDGRIALYRRDAVANLLLPAEPSSELSELAITLFEHLAARGASFLAGLTLAVEPHSQDEISAALAELTWAGLVTNDTLAPLREFGNKRRVAPRRRKLSLTSAIPSGRWSLVSELCGAGVPATKRAHSLCLGLLERHGIVSREVAKLEEIVGGFAAIYPVLRALEEAGKIRRGYFAEALGGAQFAYPGAVDRLRAVADEKTGVVCLAALDPANPFGWQLPWPEPEGGATSRPRRAAGAAVIIQDGELEIFIDTGGRRMLTFGHRDVEIAARALAQLAARRRGRYLRVESINDQPARSSVHAKQLLECGFFADTRGLVLEVS